MGRDGALGCGGGGGQGGFSGGVSSVYLGVYLFPATLQLQQLTVGLMM